jgi:hypothetical protein
VNVELTEEERELLLETLRRVLGELRSEIYKTEAFDYKEALKAREAAITGLIDRLDLDHPSTTGQ